MDADLTERLDFVNQEAEVKKVDKARRGYSNSLLEHVDLCYWVGDFGQNLEVAPLKR